MQLKPEQVEKFKQLHKDHPEFQYSDKEIATIANFVANYYLALFHIYQRIENEKEIPITDDDFIV